MAEAPAQQGLLNHQSFGTIAPYEPNMVERAQGLLAQGLMKFGYDPRDAYFQANKIINTQGDMGAADFTPIAGDLIGAQDSYDMGVDAKRAFDREEYLKALGYGAGSAATGILSGLGVLGTIAPPVDKAIDAARVGVKKATGLLDNQYKTPIGPKQPIKAYHGTRADITPNFKFRDDLIGSQTDEGYYGRGHYFTGLPGEASYYGPNVGKFEVNLQNPFDLNYKGDSYAMDDRFIDGYEKVKQFGVTDKLADDSYRVYKEFEGFIDKNVDVIPFQGGGYIARIDHPVLKDVQSGIPSPKGTVEDAKKSLLRKSLDQARWHTDTYPEIRVDRSMSDLLAGAEGGPASLSNALKEKGYDGILYGDEIIAFYPSNIKVEQTPSFRKWFGNSKVVDEAGEPLTVYHSTLKDFDKFETTTDRSLGAHFGSEEAANNRIESFINRHEENKGITLADKPSQIMPVNLSLKKPFRMDDMISWQPEEVANRINYYISERNLDMPYIKPKHMIDESKNAVKIYNNDEIVSALKKGGYDGIVYENIIEGGGDSYIAFDPEQIKSIYNRGTYDPKDANILKGIAPIAGAGLLGAGMMRQEEQQPQQGILN